MPQNIFELGLTPPPGVAFIQWGDGSIRIRYAAKDVVPIRSMLLTLARSLTEQAIKRLGEEREAEIARQKMPLSRLETIQNEMKILQHEMTDFEKEAVIIERSIESAIREVAPTESMSAKAIVSKVVMPPQPQVTVVDTAPFENAPGVVIGKVQRDTVDATEFED